MEANHLPLEPQHDPAQHPAAPPDAEATPPAAPTARAGERDARRPPSVLRAMAAGALGGIVGTTAMTLAIGAAQKVGLLGRMPPKKITKAMLHALDLHPSEETTNVLSALAHYGFGASMGALFGLVHRRTRDIAPAAIQGLAFGTLVWVTAYEVVIPALRIMPPPSFDRPFRPSSMLFGHLVYGAVLGATLAAAERALADRPITPSEEADQRGTRDVSGALAQL